MKAITPNTDITATNDNVYSKFLVWCLSHNYAPENLTYKCGDVFDMSNSTLREFEFEAQRLGKSHYYVESRGYFEVENLVHCDIYADKFIFFTTAGRAIKAQANA